MSGTIDLTDLAMLIQYLTVPNVTLACPEAANISGTGSIDLTDLAMLIQYLTIPNVILPNCPSGGGLMDPITRMAAVTAVENQLNGLNGLPSATRNQQILNFMQGRPEFEAVGMSESGNNVWGRFTDGVLFMVGANFGELKDSLPGDPLPPDTFPMAPPLSRAEIDRLYGHLSAAEAANYDDLPTSARFRVIRTVGSGFSSAITTSNRLRSWLSSNGYANAGSGATIEELRTVGGEGFIFYVGHGGDGLLRNNASDYGLWTSTKATVANAATYADDLIHGRLCIIAATSDTNSIGLPVAETRWGITSKFIQFYWGNLSANSMVIITACASDSVPAFRQAIQAKGGPAYFGWDATLDCDGGCYAAEFLVDRFLGANKAYPRENPKQRPFDVPKVFADLQSRNFHIQPGGDGVNSTSTRMRYHPGASNFGLLAPSIQFLDLYGVTDTLTINGLFGEDPGTDGEVTVDGTPLTISSWSPTVIKCHIPLRGPGSMGPVIVQKKGTGSGSFRKSNVVNITQWEGTMTQTRHEEGSLELTVTYHVRVRADMHSHRDEPGETPFKPITPFYDEQDATGEWDVSGTAHYDEPPDGEVYYDYTWEGGAALPLYDSTNPGTTFFHYLGSADAQQKRLTLAINALITDGWTITETRTTPISTETYNYLGAWATTMDLDLYDDIENFYYYTLPMDQDFNILAGNRSAQNYYHVTDFGPLTHAQIHIEWPAMPAQHPPDQNEAQ